MATTPPFDPNNPNDPRRDPRWQRNAAREQAKANQRAWRDYNRAQKEQWRAYYRANTRTSAVGPLLLISFGVLFAIARTGHTSLTVFLDRYGRWWPLFLIGAGMVRLVEWLLVRRSSREGSPICYTLGGGTRFLLFLLVLLGLGFSASKGIRIDGADMEKMLGNKHESDPAPVVYDLPAGGTLFVRNPYGNVTINGLSDDGKMHLEAHNQVWVRSDSDADSKLKGLEAKVSSTDKAISLTVASADDAHADLTISVPAGTAVTVNTERGNVHIGDLKSNATVNSNNGNIEVKAVTGLVSLRSNHRSSDISVSNVNGDVSLEGRGSEISISQINGAVNIHGEYYSTIRLQQVSRGVTFKSMRTEIRVARLDGELQLGDGDDFRLERVAGPVMISTKSRNIEMLRVNGDVQVKNSNGSVNVASVSPTGAVDITNSDGSVTLSMPHSAAFTVQADTSDGDVHNDFALSNRSIEDAGSISGNVNGGGKPVRIRTSHGDITLQRGEMPPLPPVPPVPPVPHVATEPPVPPSPPTAPSADDLVHDALANALKNVQGEVADAQKKLNEARSAEDKRAAQIQLQALKGAEQALKSAAKKPSYQKKKQDDSF